MTKCPNVIDAQQAEAMVLYMLEGTATPSPAEYWRNQAKTARAQVDRLRKIAGNVMAKHDPGNEMFSGEDGARRTFAFVTDAAIALESIARATGGSK